MVCHSGRIKGQPGVAMDDLIYICTKLARQIDAQVSPASQSVRPPRLKTLPDEAYPAHAYCKALQRVC